MSDITVITARRRLTFIDFHEIWVYRELFWTFVTRDLKVRYKQTLIGGLWAVFQPLVTMIIFSVFFGAVVKISSDNVPYPIFSYAGLILWTYFAGALSAASNSLVNSSNLITKVYFPRIIIPLAATLTGLVDYAVATTLLVVLFIMYHITPPVTIVFLPVILLLTWFLASGIGLWLSAINVKYRDVVYATPFFISILLYVTPIIYPVSIAPRYHALLTLNPLTGLIEAHRALILGNHPVDLNSLLISVIVSAIIFATGALYFRSVERYFSDII